MCIAGYFLKISFKEGRGGHHQLPNMQVQEKREGKPKKRCLGNTTKDMKEYKMTEDMAKNRSVWRMKTKAITTWRSALGEKAMKRRQLTFDVGVQYVVLKRETKK